MTLLYRLYQIFIAAPILLLLTIATTIAVVAGTALGDAAWWSYYPGRWWSKTMVRVLLLPIKVEGLENMSPTQSYVIIPNHQGAFDIFLVYGYLNRAFKWMMKEELRSMPLIGRASESAGFLFVDHHGGPKKMKELHDHARNILQEGMSVVIFPEGARTWNGKLRPFKRGAFQLADELQLPLLPITINGSFQVLPRSKGFNFVTWHPLKMTIHAPIMPQGQGSEGEHETMDKAYHIIESALEAPTSSL